MNLRKFALVAMTGLLLTGTVPTGSFAQSESLPSRITITIPFAEGGGSDTLVRMITPYLQQNLPNNPSIIVQNQPGGGGLPGSNQFYRAAQRDGSELLAMSSSVFFANLLNDRQVQFEMDQFIPVYISPLGAVVYVADETGATQLADVAGIGDTRLVYGAASPTSSDVLTILALDLLGLNVAPVFGSQRGAARIAFERGEFNVDHQSTAAYSANVAPLVASGDAIPLMVFGFANEAGEIVRDPANPDIPTFFEVYESTKGEPLDGPARRAWEALFNASISTGKALVLPPETSQAVVDAYVVAFEKLLVDQEFLDRARAEIGDYPQATGEAALAQFRGASSLDEEAFNWLADWYEAKLGVSIRG